MVSVNPHNTRGNYFAFAATSFTKAIEKTKTLDSERLYNSALKVACFMMEHRKAIAGIILTVGVAYALSPLEVDRACYQISPTNFACTRVLSGEEPSSANEFAAHKEVIANGVVKLIRNFYHKLPIPPFTQLEATGAPLRKLGVGEISRLGYFLYGIPPFPPKQD